jgi:transcriptional regulator with GAF, ATPase, and Fis domain
MGMMTEAAVDLASDLKDLVRLATSEEVDDLVRRGLDWISRLAPYDLATLFDLRDAKLVVRAARGRLAQRVLESGLALALDDFPTIKEAIETRRARAFTEEDHVHGDGDPFDGLLDFPPGHSCMVVPLCAGDRALGVLTLDRAQCETYPAEVVNLVEVYAQILAIAIQSAEQRTALARLSRASRAHAKLLEDELGGASGAGFETAQNPTMQDIVRRARQVAEADTPVLILGETGTGKERLARAIHAWSPRADGPFVTINCAAIPSGLLESELFGHVRGAFTGATRDRAGRFQMANGGTLLLDEIGELGPELQAKLLRVLQERTFEPVGADRPVKVDVRILAATHVDLDQAIRDRRFREDLYYRLNVFPIVLPPLRDRLEDLPAIAEAVLDELGRRTGRRARLSAAGLAKLAGHAWPGNVRELANVLERATILAAGQEIGPDALELPGGALPPPRRPARDRDAKVGRLDDAMRRHIEDVLRATHGRIYGAGGAAAILGVPPSTLQSKMKKLGIATRTPS